MHKKVLFLLLFTIILVFPVGSRAWDQVNPNGFGNPDNSDTWHMTEYNGYLYASTYNSNTGCEVWRTQGVGGPPYTDWVLVNTSGFGNSDTEDCISMVVYNGYLYVGTANSTIGGGIWRTAGVGGPPFTDWTQVNADGFGESENDAWSMIVYGGYLYVGTNGVGNGAKVWRTAASGGPPYTDWTQVNTDGFGDTDNENILSMTIYNGSLFATTSNGSDGCAVWRTAASGGPPYTDWTQVNTDGFGDSNNRQCLTSVEYNGNLFIGTGNGVTGGEVWRTAASGGPPYTDWTQVNTDGFGESNNNGQVFTMEVYNGFLYAGTTNSAGGEVWRTAGVGGPPFADWIKVNTNGFGDLHNNYIYSMAVYNGLLYAGTSNNDSTSGTQIWVTGTTGPTGIPTMTEWGMIIFVALAGLGATYYLRKQKTVKG